METCGESFHQVRTYTDIDEGVGINSEFGQSSSIASKIRKQGSYLIS